jgi:quinoprotein glucose dehydrogenase
VWLLAGLAVVVSCTPATEDRGWPVVASDGASSRYSPLDEIGPDTFQRLVPAWTWRSADLAWRERWHQRWEQEPSTDITDFQLTPLVVDGVLYGITSMGFVFALDATTGSERWVTDLGVHGGDESDKPPRLPPAPTHRGVAYWRDGEDERIYALAYHAWLVALDARTGRLVESFGQGGRVDLLENLLGRRPQRTGNFVQKSPPAIVGETVVVGSSVGDRPMRLPATRGDIRGYDVRTGAYKWTFHTVPLAGQPGVETWAGKSWKHAGASNAWAPISVDSELGIAYVATSAPTNDFYGGHRVGDNLFSQSLLALDGETGRRLWHQQLIRHGLWDYDLAAAPNLIDIEVDGRRVRAVAQVTKQGFTFVFDRETGEPVWPIEDRPVPLSDVPGEVASPTQRFPTRPPPFERQGTLEEHLVDLTPELRAKARERFRRWRTGPLFTPPSLEGTLMLPGPSGGASWQGAAADPDGVLFVGSVMMPAVVSVLPGGGPGGRKFRYVAGLSLSLPGWITKRISIFQPPYSRITAIDLNRGEIRWQIPNGDGPRDAESVRELDLPPMGSQARACLLVTPRLVIAGDGAEHFLPALGDPVLHAYDKRDGSRIADLALPGQTTGCPITYSVGGRQYLVVATGGMRHEPALFALRLP